jgi:hypothetical protein
MNSESSEQAIHSLQDEIRCLTEEQTDAIETETFIGLTADETRAYEFRRARIANLIRQLRLLETAAAA